MDTLFIRRLPVQAVVGCYPWEQRMPQPLWLDLEIAIDCQKSAQTDRLENTVSYVAVQQYLQQWFTQNSFQLVEALAEALATTLRAEFNLPWLRLTVTKPGVVVNTQHVGVTIERGHRDA